MKIELISKPSVTIIGKSKWVKDGSGVQDVWQDANCHFDEVLPLAQKDAQGKVVGVWGAMSDRSMAFKPWENHYSEGFYLAGVECTPEAKAPGDWTRWVIPAFRYLKIRVENNYREVMTHILNDYLPKHQLSLAGAIQEFYDPSQNGQLYLLFPIDGKSAPKGL